MHTIFSYNLDNEISFDEKNKPLSLRTGTYTAMNGVIYNMALTSDRQRLIDENLVFWINSLVNVVKKLVSSALVAPGFFSPAAVLGADPRVIRTYWAIAPASKGGSNANFIDLHAYYDTTPLSTYFNAFEINSYEKPLILGEFGSYSSKFSSVNVAALGARDEQVLTCKNYGFSGWLYWTYDTFEGNNTGNIIYTMMQNGGVVNGILAPITRPNPCIN